MLIEPGEDIVEHAAGSEVWAAAVEAHLDAHPLPVDEAAVRRSAARLERRLRQPIRQRRWRAALAVAAAAALGLLAAQPALLTSPQAVTAPEPDAMRAIIGPAPAPAKPLPRRPMVPIVAAPDAVVLVDAAPDSTVLLVQEGTVQIGDEVVSAGTWAIVGQPAGGEAIQITFPDGQAPPLDGAALDAEDIDTRLERLRWDALPERSRATLQRLLEDRP